MSWWDEAVGRCAEVNRSFTADEVTAYRELTGDGAADPQHVVPWPLVAGAVSLLLGTRLPGRGTNWLKQSFSFDAPVPVGAPVAVSVEITRVRSDKRLVDLATVVRLDDGMTVATGRALVLAPEEIGALGDESP
jgi:3-hydroxybutyryl-CoA dehydratase